jgi:CRISPR-associated protein Csd1
MFKAIIELGKRLEKENKLPAPGYYYYGEPIKWKLHLRHNKPDFVYIEEAQLDKPRPFSGKTSGIEAHPCVDEAGYVLGVMKQKGGGIDKKAKEKNRRFIQLLRKAYRSSAVKNKELKGALWIAQSMQWRKLAEQVIPTNILSKDWCSLVFNDGPFADVSLYEHPEIKDFWLEELKERTRQITDVGKAKTGVCSICGQKQQLARKIPVGVKLYRANAPHPLHSFNKDAFVSYLDGTNVYDKKAHLGQCAVCGDTIARTLNYLADKGSALHYKVLMLDKRKGKLDTETTRNQFAFFWLKDEQPINVGETTLDPAELLKSISLIIDRTDSTDKNSPPPDLMQLENLLNVPWTGRDASTNIANNAFYLLILSPNKGRIAVRDWLDISLDKLQQNLTAFLEAQRIIDPEGKDKRCFGIPDILKAVEASNISKEEYKTVELGNPNATRTLLRCAYLGEAPPIELLDCAVTCFRHPNVLKRYEAKYERDRFAVLQHQLVSIMKLILTHPKSEVTMNNDVNQTAVEVKSLAFLSGSLLAVLEEAQLASMNWKINTTLVDQFYSTASSAPCSVMGMLVSRVTSQHMPRLRKIMGWKFETLEILLEEILDALHSKGGFPQTLTLKQQAEFSLGFYTRRAAFRRQRPDIAAAPKL